MRRIFEDRQGYEIGQFDLWKYGYDARTRPWYRETMKSTGPCLVALPFVQHRRSSDHRQRTVAGHGDGVLAADLKLDNFSDFVQAQRPGAHGTS